MFADACEKAMKYTRPVIVSTRAADGTVASGCAAFIVLNGDGWALTAGHLFDSFVKWNADSKALRGLEGSGKDPEPGTLTNHSFWWGWDGVRMAESLVLRDLDLAVVRLEGLKPGAIAEYPVFKDPAKMRPGTSLCRIGFPFVDSTTDFDEERKQFRIRKGVLPMPFFPNEGMHTRNVTMGPTKDGRFERLYVETSSPGMKGQSGGPIFDRNGFVAGLQVMTVNMPLGFAPSVKRDGRTVVENQFMNVGLGVHVKTIVAVLESKGVKFQCETDDQGFRIVGRGPAQG